MPVGHPRSFDFAGATYRAPRLCAWTQWDALQFLRPALSEIERRANPRRRGVNSPATAANVRLGEGAADMAADLLSLVDADDLSALFDIALSGVERLDDGEWAPAWDPTEGVALFDDLPAGRVTLLAMHVLWRNLTPYFQHRPVQIEAIRSINYEPAALPNGLSWLMAPVERNLCRYESLHDGALDLLDIARMNDLLAVSAENRSRAHKAAEDEARAEQRARR